MRSVARSAVERVLPERLGRPFRWLVTSSWISNIGDGVALAAGPLLVASETRSPLLVALAAVMQFLPRLLFGLVAGVVADRVDRRHLIAVANACRVVVLAALVATLVTGQVSIAVVLGAVFLLGVGETFADTTTATLLPMLVAKADLGVANARLLAGIITLDQLVGPPLGALLFGLGRQWPFVTQAVCVALSLVLVLRLELPAHGRRATAATAATGGTRRSTLVAEIREGLGWVRRHAAVRTLVLTILIFNVTFGASWSVLVLYAQERLGLGNLGFGLLTSALACGGILGTVSYGWLERHVSLAWIMRGGLVVETLTHLVLALTTVPAVALATMFVFGAHAFIWGTTSTAVRQRAVPMPMQGRVQSVYMLGVTGGFVLGSLLGGVVAHAYGVTAPFWVGFVGSAAFLALLWHQLLHVAHADEEALARAGTDERAP